MRRTSSFVMLTLLVQLGAAPALAGESDTLAVGPERPAARELAARARVRKEAIGDEEVTVLPAGDARLQRSSAMPRRTGFIAAGMGFAVLPPPAVPVEERPARADRGFRVER